MRAQASAVRALRLPREPEAPKPRRTRWRDGHAGRAGPPSRHASGHFAGCMSVKGISYWFERKPTPSTFLLKSALLVSYVIGM